MSALRHATADTAGDRKIENDGFGNPQCNFFTRVITKGKVIPVTFSYDSSR